MTTEMGLMDFLNKGEKKPAPKQEQAPQSNNPFAGKQQDEAAPDLTAQPAQAASQQPGVNMDQQQNIYTVKSGDSLSKISSRVYGDPSQWRKIYEANQDIVKNPDLIHPGQKLVIPR